MIAFWLSSGIVHFARTQPIFYMDSILYQSFQNADISTKLMEYNQWRAQYLHQNPTYVVDFLYNTLVSTAYGGFLSQQIAGGYKNECILIFGDSTLYTWWDSTGRTNTENTPQISRQVLYPGVYSDDMSRCAVAPYLYYDESRSGWYLGFLRGATSVSTDANVLRLNDVSLMWFVK